MASPVQVYSVSQVAEYIRAILERDPNLRDLWVTGEVTNVFQSGAGHVYFAIKDEHATVKAILFSGNLGGEHVVSGAQINAHGRASYYPMRGDTQIYVDLVIPAGAGALAAEYERLKAKLEGEGLFDVSRKRPLPSFPTTIGVVTSQQGAVIHDITRVLANRYPLAHVILCPASVQGDEAPLEIADGIRALNALGGVSVIIVARGGGSMEDLWAFNTEVVARAIHASHVPIVSAVGHESDYTIADLVADLRAPTPSAAATLVAPDLSELKREVLGLTRTARHNLANQLMRRAQAVESLVSRMHRTLPNTPAQRQRVDDVLERGHVALRNLLERRRQETAACEASLKALNPLAVMDRGFAVITNLATGATIASVNEVAPGVTVRARVRDGSFQADVR